MENSEKYTDELINRYIYYVVIRLPKSQRADIEKELRGLIEDMLKSRSENPSKQDVQEVLKELGRPAELAAKYRGTTRYLIGPDYFDIYFLVLKIVIAVAGFGIVIAMTVKYITTPPASVLEAIAEFISSVLSGLFQAFACVTIVFALIQYFVPSSEMLKGKGWKAQDLPPIPTKKARIKKGEPIVGIIFLVLILIIFDVAPQLFGAYVWSGDQISIIPVFNLAVLNNMLPLINAIILLGILKEIFKLISSRYTVKLAAAITLINVISMVVTIFVFISPDVWNQSFVEAVTSAYNIGVSTSAKISYFWSILPKIIVGLASFGYIVDSIAAIVKSLNYKNISAVK